jgi:hypothetical protein
MCQYLTTVKQYTLSEWCFKKVKNMVHHSSETPCRKFQSLDCSVIVRIHHMKHRTYIQVDVKNLVKETTSYILSYIMITST